VSLLLNCDLGESFGAWTMGMDSAVMAHIDQANIACGFHAGDPLIMSQTLALAKEHGVRIGAHPAYPDLVGFGRRALHCSAAEITALVLYQASALSGMAQSMGLSLEYVKPHGALYHDMMTQAQVRHAIMNAVASFSLPIRLMLQATPERELHAEEAKARGLELWFEAFADRAYDDDGKLLSRSVTGAVLNREQMLAQVQQLNQQGSVTTLGGQTLAVQADTLCVHGDNPEGVAAIVAIRELLQS
jgi:UPF0271 protein